MHALNLKRFISLKKAIYLLISRGSIVKGPVQILSKAGKALIEPFFVKGSRF